jgi:hypothetical protein
VSRGQQENEGEGLLAFFAPILNRQKFSATSNIFFKLWRTIQSLQVVYEGSRFDLYDCHAVNRKFNKTPFYVSDQF